MKTIKKTLSFVLSVLMVISAVPIISLTANAQSPGGDNTYTVIACSDYQYGNTDYYNLGATGNSGGEIIVKNILSAVSESGITSADGFLCAGDYDYDLSSADTAGGVSSLKNALTASDVDFSSSEQVFVQGNHDPQSTSGGTSPSGNNDPDSGAYGVFVINERDYMWATSGLNEQTVKQTAENLRRYLNNKIAVNYTAPIFVISHLPLHYSMRTNNDGDKMYANYLFDVLNDAGNQGLNIIFLFGHDHSNGWDDYLGGSKIYLTKGDKINIAQASRTVYEEETLSFTYMNAGYTGYYENHNTSTGTQTTSYDISDLTMTSFVITGDDVEITRFNSSGSTLLKNSGVCNYYKSEQNKDYSPDTSTVSSPQTMTFTSVSNTSYEISPVIQVSESSDDDSTDINTYTAISSYTELKEGETYLIVAKRDSIYWAATTQYTTNSSYSSSRLESIQVSPSDALNSGSTIQASSGTATTGETINMSSCEWIYQNGTFIPLSGDNAGKYIKIPNSTSGSITFSTSAPSYTVSNTFKETGYLNLRSNYLYGSYTNGTSLTYFKKTVSAVEENTWTKVGDETIVSDTQNTTPDSGLYTTSNTSPSADNCYSISRNGDVYNVQNMSGEYMNISSDGSVSWSSTSQEITLVCDNNSSITATNSNGVSATSVFDGVILYSASTYTISGGNTYTYTLDTDGIDSGSDYLIVSAKSENLLYNDNSDIGDYSDFDIENNTIVLNSNSYDWTFKTGSSASIYDGSKYVKISSSLSLSSTNSAPTFSSVGSGKYVLYRKSNNKYRHLYYSGGWTIYNNSSAKSSSTTYCVRLFKLTGSESVSAGVGYSSGTQFTTEIAESSVLEHYVYYSNESMTVARGLSSAEVVSLLKTESASTLQYSESSDGTDSSELSLSLAGLSYDFSDVDLNTSGTYSVPVYFSDDTVDTPVSTLIGEQTLKVSSSGEITDVSLDSNIGHVSYNAKSSTKTGANIVFTYSDGSTSEIPVTVGMLLGFDGNQNVADMCKESGEYTGLGVFYDYLTGYWFSDFSLIVDEAEDYPEYPSEGSVKVAKTGTASNFQNDGVAKIELSATGVPMNPGIDIVLMVDASSSMEDMVGEYTNSDGETIEVFGTSSSGGTWYDVNGNELNISTSSVSNKSTRIEKLQSAVTSLLSELAEPNSTTGVVPDIEMAIAEFNGYGNYKDGDTDTLCLISTDDHLTDTACRSNDGIGAVLTGSKDLTGNAFEDIESLSRSFNASSEISSDSGTNYDFAFDYMYDLLAAKKEENDADGENRQLIAIFMSDGAPYMYNYFSSQSSAENWNDWLQGNYASYTDVDSSSEHTYFYNGQGNSNRKADAIKGDVETDYIVIDKMCPDGTADATGDGIVDPYMTTVKGLGATMYSIGFCLTLDNATTLESMNYVLSNIASDEDKYYSANSGSQLNNAFADIADQTVQAGTEAYFIDSMGSTYDIQTSSSYVKNGTTYALDSAPVITLTNYTVYTIEDYNGGVDNITYDDIGKRTGESKIVETVSFNATGTEAYSDLLGSSNNIFVDGLITAKNFIYNSTSTAVLIDKDEDGINEFSLAPETFYWKVGIISDTEFALSYYVYLTGSMEGTRDAGSYPTNSSAILYYTNYLEHSCQKTTISPIMPWEAATISYEFYLVNADGQPVNSSGDTVPFENRVLIGNKQTDTILLNSSSTENAYSIAASANIPEGYTLFNSSAEYSITISSGTTASSAAISDNGNVITTYFYDSSCFWKGNGTIPDEKISNYANTNVAFAVLLQTSIVPDSVVIDYGLPVKIHVLSNDLGLSSSTVVNSISSSAPSVLNSALSSSEFLKNSSVSANNGIMSINSDGKCLVYTPTSATMQNEEVFYYEIFAGGYYYYGKVTVIPASNIYYEDSFFVFNESEGGYSWNTAGTELTDVFQDEDRPGTFSLNAYDKNNNYGRDSEYNSETATYSLGSSKYAVVDTDSIGNEPTAEFTFCGTGFDLFSVTSNKSGVALIKVQSLTEGITYNKTFIINAYYGYSYGQLYLDCKDGTYSTETLSSSYTVDDETFENLPLYETGYSKRYVSSDEDEHILSVNGKVYSTKPYLFTEEEDSYRLAYGWISTGKAGSEESGLYQIPIISVPNSGSLEYGTYKVTVTPKYSYRMDYTGEGEYRFYVDGIRIYNPAGISNISDVVSGAYEEDNESNATYVEVRDMLISDSENFLNKITTDDNVSMGGAMFVDGITALGSGIESALDKFKESGPNNEVYLSDGQSIIINPEITDFFSTPVSFQIGMKVVANGSTSNKASAAVKFVLFNNATSKITSTHTINISGSTEQYYDLTSFIDWMADETIEGKYTSADTIVLLNDSDAVIALTSFKWCYNSSEETENEPTPILACVSNGNTLSYAKAALLSVYDTVDTYGVEISWITDTVDVGAEAQLLLTTPSSITSVKIGNTEITEYIDDENGDRIWNYSFIVTKNSDTSYDVILTDNRGRVSEVLTTEPLTVNVEEEIVEENEEESMSGSETEEKTSANSNVFDKLTKILKLILDTFRKIIEWGKSIF